MGFKIRLSSGRYYANKKGRIQYFETLAEARAKIKRRHLKGARVVHVTKSNRTANKKTRAGKRVVRRVGRKTGRKTGRKVKKGRKAKKGRKTGRKKKIGRPKKSRGRKGGRRKVGRRKETTWRPTHGGFEGFF